jgi:hypothetical protein
MGGGDEGVGGTSWGGGDVGADADVGVGETFATSPSHSSTERGGRGTEMAVMVSTTFGSRSSPL